MEVGQDVALLDMHGMAAMHGSVAEFDSGKEEWDSYMERLEHYFVYC